MAYVVNLPCVADTYINEASKSVNYGTSDRIISGRQGQNRQYALLRFDMSSAFGKIHRYEAKSLCGRR